MRTPSYVLAAGCWLLQLQLAKSVHALPLFVLLLLFLRVELVLDLLIACLRALCCSFFRSFLLLLLLLLLLLVLLALHVLLVAGLFSSVALCFRRSKAAASRAPQARSAANDRRTTQQAEFASKNTSLPEQQADVLLSFVAASSGPGRRPTGMPAGHGANFAPSFFSERRGPPRAAKPAQKGRQGHRPLYNAPAAGGALGASLGSTTAEMRHSASFNCTRS